MKTGVCGVRRPLFFYESEVKNRKNEGEEEERRGKRRSLRTQSSVRIAVYLSFSMVPGAGVAAVVIKLSWQRRYMLIPAFDAIPCNVSPARTT